MIGIIITSHGQIAKELLETSKMFFGELQQVKACCLETDDNPDDFINVLKDSIKEVDTGDGVIVLCDLLYGTPYNCMSRILLENKDNNIKVLTGVNLAILLKALNNQSDITVDKLIEAGRDGITTL